MSLPILSLEIRREQDVVMARQRARQVAELLRFDSQDQTRIATAVSEIARNVYNYARPGRVEFELEGRMPPQLLVIRISDKGPGIPNLAEVLGGAYRSKTGLGLGILGARRLMDRLAVDSSAGGTVVTLTRILPRAAPLLTGPRVSELVGTLLQKVPLDPMEEMQQQNRELILAMDELRRKQDELTRLNQELEDTNRGVVALYAEVDEQASHLRRADEMKSRFLSHMSHEFRTPLNSIMALARILKDRMDGDLTAEQEKQVGFIRRAAEELSELVNDLLDIAKVEAGRVDIHAVEMEIKDLFATLRGMLRPLLLSQSLQLVFEAPDDLPAIETDEGKVAQILRNLISNALKFTEEGEVRVSASFDADQEAMVIDVTDTGIGIAPEDQEKVFIEFGQIDGPIQRRVKGSGLGLPLSRKLATLLQGEITLESQVGVGSRFSLRLPRQYRERTSETAAADIVSGSSRDPLRLPILVVEDSPESMHVYEVLLRDTAFQVMAATSVPQAARMIAEIRPKAVILDIQLRGHDAWSFLGSLKSADASRGLPVLVVTNVDDERKAMSLGADAYSAKPVERPWLLNKLRILTQGLRLGTVLLVDDDDVARYTAKSILSRTALDLLEASSGEEALARAVSAIPDAIVLDLVMPGLSGFDVVDRLAADPVTRAIPVIVLSSLPLDAEQRRRLTSRSVVRILSKSALSGQGQNELRDALLYAGIGRERIPLSPPPGGPTLGADA